MLPLRSIINANVLHDVRYIVKGYVPYKDLGIVGGDSALGKIYTPMSQISGHIWDRLYEFGQK